MHFSSQIIFNFWHTVDLSVFDIAKSSFIQLRLFFLLLHFRDNYGFVTYYNTKDAFTAIENGSKLRRPNELPFDLCFGGRRQFCKTSYADLGELSYSFLLRFVPLLPGL